MANVARLVRDQLQLESFAEPLELLLERDDPRLHRLGDGDGVRATFFINGDLHRFTPIDAADDLSFFVTAADPRHILKTDIAAGGVDHDVPHVRGSLELVDGADEVLRLAILQPAAGEVDVLGGETGNDLARAET